MGRKKVGVIWSLSDEEFKNIVETSFSIADILRKLHLQIQGTHYRVVNRRIEELKLDTSHFKSQDIKLNSLKRLWKNRMPTSELLVKSSTNSRNAELKKRIIDEKIIPYVCKCCDNEGFWNGKKLTLQLEHINGDNTDNRIENLCFLCPNCHSQTKTFAGRNSRKRKCNNCSKYVRTLSQKKTGLCRSCYDESMEVSSKKPSKEILEKLIFEKSFVEIGKMYGVSDNAVRKWCKSYNLPFRKKEIKMLV